MSAWVPYVGIAGVKTLQDVEVVRRCARVPAGSARLMAGVLVSRASLRGEPVTNPRYPSWAAARELLWSLNDFAWPAVHYNSRSEPATLRGELLQVLRDLPPDGALQLNIVRPDPDLFEELAARFPGVEFVLQVNGASLPRHPAPVDVAEYTHRYPRARHALLDLSGGRGRTLDYGFTTSVLRGWPLTGPVPAVAGGLGPECGPLLRELLAHARTHALVGFSVDAESRLRTPDDQQLDPDKCEAYVRVAVDAMGSSWR